MGVVQVKTFGTVATTTPATNTLTSAPTLGNMVFVAVGMDDNFAPGVVTSVTDNNSNSWSLYVAENDANSGDNCRAEIWWCSNITANSTTPFTVTAAYSSTMEVQIALMETTPYAADQQGVQNSSGATSSTVTATHANSTATNLVIAMCKLAFGASAQTTPANSGYTLWGNGTGDAGGAPVNASYKVLSALETSSANWSWTTSESNASILITLKPPVPAITAQPVAQTVASGSTATFSETDSGGTSWQWYSAPITSLYENVPGSWSSIGGATSSSYTTGTLSNSDNGTWYYCAVTNAYGTTNTAAVRVWITAQPSATKGLLLKSSWPNDYRALNFSHSDGIARKAFNFGETDQIGYVLWSTYLFGAPSSVTTISASIGSYSWAGTLSTLPAGAISASPGAYTWSGTTSTASGLINAGVGAYSWAGVTATTSQLINGVVGTYSWAGTTATTSALINAGIGAYTWSGTTSSASGLILAMPGTYTWAGTTATASGLIQAAIGTYTWSGTTGTLGGPINATAGAYTWSASTSTLSQLINGIPGAYTWSESVDSTVTQLIAALPAAFAWAGTTATFSQVLSALTGAYTWSATTASLGAGAIQAIVGAYTWIGVGAQVPTQISSDPTFGYVWSGTTSGIQAGSSPAGRRRKRYGLIDGERLLIFDTKAKYEAAIAAKRTQIAPKLRRIKIRTPVPVLTVSLPQLKADAVIRKELPRYEQGLASRYHESLVAMAEGMRRREDEEIATAISHLDHERRTALTVMHALLTLRRHQ